jgi:hypothetical protein
MRKGIESQIKKSTRIQEQKKKESETQFIHSQLNLSQTQINYLLLFSSLVVVVTITNIQWWW